MRCAASVFAPMSVGAKHTCPEPQVGASPLRDLLRPRGDPEPPPSLRLAIVGIGRAGDGDDGAGPALCAALERLALPAENRLVVDAGTAPENATGLLRRFRPDTVVLVDAAEMGEPPGAVRWLEGARALGCSASTHTLPLGLLATYLAESLGCRVRLLGIQPAAVSSGDGLSAPVRQSVERLARRLARPRKPASACGLESCVTDRAGMKERPR